MGARRVVLTEEQLATVMRERKLELRRPIRQAVDEVGAPAGAVLPAAEAGWIAWWPGHRDLARLAAFTRAHYQRGFECELGRVGDRLLVAAKGQRPAGEPRELEITNVQVAQDEAAPGRPWVWVVAAHVAPDQGSKTVKLTDLEGPDAQEPTTR